MARPTRTGSRSSVGDYLIAIGGKQVKAGDEYWELLNDRLNRKVEVTFNNKPSEDGAWKTRIETINGGAYSDLALRSLGERAAAEG